MLFSSEHPWIVIFRAHSPTFLSSILVHGKQEKKVDSRHQRPEIKTIYINLMTLIRAPKNMSRISEKNKLKTTFGRFQHASATALKGKTPQSKDPRNRGIKPFQNKWHVASSHIKNTNKNSGKFGRPQQKNSISSISSP